MSKPFKMRSGNSPAFKNMGSSPLNQNLFESIFGKKFKDTKLGRGFYTEDGGELRVTQDLKKKEEENI